MHLDYIRFFRELIEAKELKISQTPEYIERETGYVISTAAAYEFLDEKRESCPGSATVKVWEQAFKIRLSARYYGAEKAFPKGNKKAK